MPAPLECLHGWYNLTMVSLRIIPPHAVSVRVVLVQPRNPLNILAAARAARNFGLGDIAVVDVYPRAWTEALEKDVDRETPHGPRGSSRGWLGDARKYDTLMEAIGDCDWVLGTSSLERRRVDPDEVIDLRELPARIAETCGLAPSPHPTPDTPHPCVVRRSMAILFGSEKRGLANEHLMHCQHILRIPTAEPMPSMNLGQAVALVCYELARSGVVGKLGASGRPGGEAGSVVRATGSKNAETANLANFAETAESSEVAVSSEHSAPAKFSDWSASSKLSVASKDVEVAKDAESAVDADVSEFAENAEEPKESANAAERQALVEQLADLIKDNSVSSNDKRQGQIGTRHRNLQKLITRLPLSKADVRLLLGVVKDARNASSVSSEESEKPASAEKP